MLLGPPCSGPGGRREGGGGGLSRGFSKRGLNPLDSTLLSSVLLALAFFTILSIFKDLVVNLSILPIVFNFSIFRHSIPIHFSGKFEFSKFSILKKLFFDPEAKLPYVCTSFKDCITHEYSMYIPFMHNKSIGVHTAHQKIYNFEKRHFFRNNVFFFVSFFDHTYL